MATGPPSEPVSPGAAASSLLDGLRVAWRSERLLGPFATEVSRVRETARDSRVADQLELIRRRRPSGSLAQDWADRIDMLGDLPLDSRARRAAFPEMLEAFSLTGLRLVAIREKSSCAVDQHAVSMAGRLYRGDRLVATWHREILLDTGLVFHHWLTVEPEFRRAGIGPALLQQGLDLYDRLGLKAIGVHAALETGRWHWARCGFDFNPDDARVMRAYFDTAVQILGLGIDTSSFKTANQFALAEPDVTISMARLASLAGVEGSRAIRELAAANGIDFYGEIPAAKAIMLTGPAWRGHLLLSGPQRAIFDTYVQSRLAMTRRSVGGLLLARNGERRRRHGWGR